MSLASTATLPAATALQSLGPLAEPPALLIGLVILAAILVVGRVLMAIAWRLVLIGIVAVVVLWVFGMLGFQFGIL